MATENWEQVGVIGVDAGLCWVGDPCYIIGQEASEQPTKTWSGFCDLLGDKDALQLNFRRGHAGLGVVVGTGGDGCFPVQVRRDTDGRIVELRVSFE